MKMLWYTAGDAVVTAGLFAGLGTDSALAWAWLGSSVAVATLTLRAIADAARHGTTDEIRGLSLRGVITRGTQPSLDTLWAESKARQRELSGLMVRHEALSRKVGHE